MNAYPRANAVLLDDDDCRVAVEFYRGRVFFHCTLGKHRISGMKKLRAAVPKMERLMAELGFVVLDLFIPRDTPTLKRFCERFGFHETSETDGWLFMERKVCDA